MTTLLVLGFPYSTTADAAAQDVLLQEHDLATEPDAVAVVSRGGDGAFHITTNHRPEAQPRRFFWHLLLPALILLPGAADPPDKDLEALVPGLEALGLDASFQAQVRAMLAPDTSALFLLATEPVPAEALTALGRFGGKLLAASLVADTETRISNALQRSGAVWAAGGQSSARQRAG